MTVHKSAYAYARSLRVRYHTCCVTAITKPFSETTQVPRNEPWMPCADMMNIVGGPSRTSVEPVARRNITIMLPTTRARARAAMPYDSCHD